MPPTTKGRDVNWTDHHMAPLEWCVIVAILGVAIAIIVNVYH